MKQTAVEWLIEQILEIPLDDSTNAARLKKYVNKVSVFEKALEMEKQQIIKTGLDCGSFIETEDMEQYYTKTYGSKGSDEHIVDTNKMISSQTEISDEEIEEAAPYVPRNAHDYYVGHKDGFIEGAQWYREQLKQRQ